jgi:hypothetical protein
MSLVPFSRETMRALKAQKDEEIKILKIESVVKQIYEDVVRFAEKNTETLYRVTMPTPITNHVQPRTVRMSFGSIVMPSNIKQNDRCHPIHAITLDDILANMEEILARLRSVFPDCLIEYKKVSLAMGKDKKEYDISTLDERIRPFIDLNQSWTNEYIVIDWS